MARFRPDKHVYLRGDRIREKRAQKGRNGWSRAHVEFLAAGKFGDLCDIREQSLGKWERGDALFTERDTAGQLALILGCDLQEITSEEQPEGAKRHRNESWFVRDGLFGEIRTATESEARNGSMVYQDFSGNQQPIRNFWCDAARQDTISASLGGAGRRSCLRVDFSYAGRWPPNVCVIPLDHKPLAVPQSMSTIQFSVKGAQQTEGQRSSRDRVLVVTVRLRDCDLRQWKQVVARENQQVLHQVSSSRWTPIAVELSPAVATGVEWQPLWRERGQRRVTPRFDVLTGVVIEFGTVKASEGVGAAEKPEHGRGYAQIGEIVLK